MKWWNLLCKAWQRVTWLKKLLAALSMCLVFWKTRKILIVFSRPNTTPFVMIYAKNFKLFKKKTPSSKKMPLRNNNDDDNLINPRVSTPRVIPSFGAWKPYLYRTKTEKKKRLMSKNHVFNLSLKRFMVLDLGSLWQLRILARGPRIVQTTPITQVWTVWGALFSFFLHSHISRY